MDKKNTGINCPARTVKEEVLHEAVVRAVNSMLKLSDDFYDKYRESLINALGGSSKKETEVIDAKLKDLQKKLISVNDMYPGYDDIVNEIYRLREEKHQMALNDADREDAIRQADKLMEFIRKQPSEIKEYDDALVRKLISKVRISDDSMTVIFKTGYEELVKL